MGRDVVDHLLAGEDLALGSDGRRGHGQFTVWLEAGMGDPAHMPKLQKNPAARLVHGRDNLFPAPHLGLGMDAGSIGVTVAAGGDGGGFRDDQTGGGALPVILRIHFGGDVAFGGPAPGEGRHEDAVGQLQRPDLDGIKEVGHRLKRINYFGLNRGKCLNPNPADVPLPRAS